MVLQATFIRLPVSRVPCPVEYIAILSPNLYFCFGFFAFYYIFFLLSFLWFYICINNFDLVGNIIAHSTMQVMRRANCNNSESTIDPFDSNSLCLINFSHFHNPNELGWGCSWLFLELHVIFAENYIQTIWWWFGPQLTNFEFRISHFSKLNEFLMKWGFPIDLVKWVQFRVTIWWIFIWTLHIKFIVGCWCCSPFSILFFFHFVCVTVCVCVHLMDDTICSFYST